MTTGTETLVSLGVFNPAAAGHLFIVRQSLVVCSSSPQLVAKADPTRIYLRCAEQGGGATVVTGWQYGGSGSNRPAWPSNQSIGIEHKWADVASLVGYDVYAVFSFGPITVGVMEICFNVESKRYARLRRKLDDSGLSRLANAYLTGRRQT